MPTISRRPPATMSSTSGQSIRGWCSSACSSSGPESLDRGLLRRHADSAVRSRKRSVEMRDYGTMADGRIVHEHELRNAEGMSVRFLSLGGIVTAIEVPDRAGRRDNVVLGLPDLAAYEARNHSYRFGALMGRY